MKTSSTSHCAPYGPEGGYGTGRDSVRLAEDSGAVAGGETPLHCTAQSCTGMEGGTNITTTSLLSYHTTPNTTILFTTGINIV